MLKRIFLYLNLIFIIKLIFVSQNVLPDDTEVQQQSMYTPSEVNTDQEIGDIITWLNFVKGNEDPNWMNNDYYFKYLEVTMKGNTFGPFTIFVIESFDIINIKDSADIQALFESAFILIEIHLEKGTFKQFGPHFNEKVVYFIEMCAKGPQGQENILQTMSFVHQVLVSRGVLVDPMTKEVLDIADSLYNPHETKVLFFALKELYDYPERKSTKKTPELHSTSELIHILFHAVVSPLQRALTTETGKSFFEKVDKLIEQNKEHSTTTTEQTIIINETILPEFLTTIF